MMKQSGLVTKNVTDVMDSQDKMGDQSQLLASKLMAKISGSTKWYILT